MRSRTAYGLDGYRTREVTELTGATERQLHYWDATGALGPSVQPAHGSGSQRLYSRADLLSVRLLKLVSAATHSRASKQSFSRMMRDVRGDILEEALQASPDWFVVISAADDAVMVAPDRLAAHLAEIPAAIVVPLAALQGAS